MRRGTTLIMISVVAIIAGVFAVATLGGRAQACGSTLGAFAQTVTHKIAASCTIDRVLYYGGWAALVLGLAFVIVGAIQSADSPPPQQLPPGWYEHRRGRWRWWDGARWHDPPGQ